MPPLAIRKRGELRWFARVHDVNGRELVIIGAVVAEDSQHRGDARGEERAEAEAPRYVLPRRTLLRIGQSS